MNFGIFIAILSPILFGIMNTFDKFVVSHRVKDTIGYAVVAGLVNVVLGLVLVFFLNWQGLTAHDLMFPILAGVFSGACYYLYFYIMRDSDASYLVGFAYLFPIVVAALAFIFLHERLSPLAYAAAALVLLGVILLSVRAKKMKLSILVIPLAIYILLLGGYEFFIKVSTLNISFMQGLAITTLFAGITVLLGLSTKRVRAGFRKELKNIRWAFVSEFFTLGAVLTLYLAMSLLPATVVTAIAATQPLAVLVFERIVHARYGKMTKDVTLLPKLGAILMIVAGVILLSIVSS